MPASASAATNGSLAGAQALALGGERLLHFHHQSGLGEDLARIRRDGGARGAVGGVAGADARAGARFHEHVMAAPHERLHALGREADAMLLDLDLPRHADAHHSVSSWCESQRIASATSR